MDKNSVGTQYIICECGDNFPNEELLNIHLANDHGNVEVFQCIACPEAFSTQAQLQEHSRNHEAAKEEPSKTNIKPITVKNEKKKPPVIKLQNLKRIDSISLLQKLKTYSGLIKLRPAPAFQESGTYQLQMEEEPSQVLVKSEMQEPEEVATEEIYYQCDVCNNVFYTESDFNVHYQSTHAMKVEPTPEEILEDHLVSDHIDHVNVKAEVDAVDSAYYYECEMENKEPCHTAGDTDGMELLVERENKKSKRGRPKKKKTKRGRRPRIDVCVDLPPGLTPSETLHIVKERRAQIRREQLRESARRYREKHREAHRAATAKYAKNHPEVNRRSSAKYAKNHPEVSRRSSAKYAKNHPEVNRRAVAKYAKKNPEVGRRSSAKYAQKKKMEKEMRKAEAGVIGEHEIVGSFDNVCVKEEFKVELSDVVYENGGSTGPDLKIELLTVPDAVEHSILGM